MKKVIILILFFTGNFLSAQCAMCRAVVESGNAEEAAGLNTGIMYLMVFPYLLVGALFFVIIRYRKKLKL